MPPSSPKQQTTKIEPWAKTAPFLTGTEGNVNPYTQMSNSVADRQFARLNPGAAYQPQMPMQQQQQQQQPVMQQGVTSRYDDLMKAQVNASNNQGGQYNPNSFSMGSGYVPGVAGSAGSAGSNNSGPEFGTTGVMPEAERQYLANQTYSADTANAFNGLMGTLGARSAPRQADPKLQQLGSDIYSVIGGNLGPQLTGVGDTVGAHTDMQKARQQQGQLDPTQALRQFMSGQINNQILDPQAQAIINRISQNTMQNVMPGIRGNAVASGQYGGSRQGIAEGLAASQLQEDIAPALTSLYGTAFENAQNRGFGTAQGLNQQAQQVAMQNTANDLNTQQFNAGLGLQRNTQELQRQAQDVNTRQMGLSALQNLGAYNQSQEDRQLQSQMQLLDLSMRPQQQQQNNLTNYANIISQLAGLGSQQVTPLNKNTGAGILGGAAGGAAIGSMVPGIGTGVGAVAGGLLGMF